MRNWHLCWSWMHKETHKIMKTHSFSPYLLENVECWKIWSLGSQNGWNWAERIERVHSAGFPFKPSFATAMRNWTQRSDMTHILKIKGAYGVWNNSLFETIFWKSEEIYQLREWMLQLNVKRLLAVILNVIPAMRHIGGNNEKLVWGHGGVTAFSDRGKGPALAACSGTRGRAWKRTTHTGIFTLLLKKCKARTVKLQASQVKMEGVNKGKAFFSS